MGISDFVKKATKVVEKGVDQVADTLSTHPYLEIPSTLTSGETIPPIVTAMGINLQTLRGTDFCIEARLRRLLGINSNGSLMAKIISTPCLKRWNMQPAPSQSSAGGLPQNSSFDDLPAPTTIGDLIGCISRTRL